MKLLDMIRFTPEFFIVCGFLTCIPSNGLHAQESQIPEYLTRTDSLLIYEPDRSFLQSAVGLILPESVNGVLAMRDFIRSDAFQAFRSDSGDRRAVDLIYQKGLHIARGDNDISLFICFVGTMDHPKVGIRIPLFGFVIFLPLTTESDQNFQKRHSHLPAHFYRDSPAGKYGDKDKLQHFFGSALMTYLSGSGTYADIIGGWTEVLEQRYIVDGLDDPRDRRANRQGVRFGKMLLAKMKVLPSEVLIESGKVQEEEK